MITNILSQRWSGNAFVLCILSLIIGHAALSQANFNSIKSISNSEPDKKVASSLFTFSPIKNFRRENDVAVADGRDLTITAGMEGEIKKPTAANIEISFKPTSYTYPENSRSDIGIAQYSTDQLILYATVLKQYARENKFDTNYAFLSNMGMLSNKKRFFVVNLATMQVEQAGLVAHGRGQGLSIFDKQYSNEPGSKCTSLGRYIISGQYKGAYGDAYRMIGLDSSNKNALNRHIVLHSMGCIPDTDGVMPACVSEGCPAVSTMYLSLLRKIIDTKKKPVLMWIFDSNLEEVIAREVSEIDKAGSADSGLNKPHSCSLHIPYLPGIQ